MSKLGCLSVVFLTSVLCVSAVSAQGIAELTDSIGKNVAAQNWDEVDQGYETLYSAYQAEHGVASRQALSMAKVLGEWKIQAYRNELLTERPEQTMSAASAFYSNLIDEIVQGYGEDSEELIDPMYGQAMVEYHLFQIATRRPTSDYNGIGSEVTEEEQCVGSEDGGAVLDCSYVEVPSRDYLNSQAAAKEKQTSEHWQAIADSLQKVVAICRENQYLLDEAEALTHLGDYYLYAGEHVKAIELYNSAYKQLSVNTEGSEWIQRLFTMPTVVPALTRSLPGAAPVQIAAQGIGFGFSINSEGRAEDIKVLSGNTSSNRQTQQNIIGIISGATFRPGFDKEGVLESRSVEI